MLPKMSMVVNRVVNRVFTDTNTGGAMRCHKVGCTDPLAKNYDSTATLECNKEGAVMITTWVGIRTVKTPTHPTDVVKYDCDNPLLENRWARKMP